jgi:opacity protein-like surface antigen
MAPALFASAATARVHRRAVLIPAYQLPARRQELDQPAPIQRWAYFGLVGRPSFGRVDLCFGGRGTAVRRTFKPSSNFRTRPSCGSIFPPKVWYNRSRRNPASRASAWTFCARTPGGNAITINQNQGGNGWYGTVGAGYDWQFSSWVFGIFGDGQFGSLKGTIQDPTFNSLTASIKMQDAWAAGARLGYLVAPNVLSYVNGGYSGSQWSGTTFLNTFSGFPTGVVSNSFTRNGVFVGGGVENSLNIFGLSAPGFMKTEYRAAYYGNQNITELSAANTPTGHDIAFKALGADHRNLAGLSLQLGRPGGCEVLIFSLHLDDLKAPVPNRGFLLKTNR